MITLHELLAVVALMLVAMVVVTVGVPVGLHVRMHKCAVATSSKAAVAAASEKCSEIGQYITEPCKGC